MSYQNDDGLRLKKVMDAMAESASAASDQELLDDAKAAGLDVDAEAKRVRELLLGAALRAKKNRLREAQRAHERAVTTMGGKVSLLPTDPKEQRVLLNCVLQRLPQMRGAVVTLQHREFDSFSDEDVESALRQLEMLGLLEDSDSEPKP